MVESYSKNANHNMRRPVVKEEIVDLMRQRQKQVTGSLKELEDFARKENIPIIPHETVAYFRFLMDGYRFFSPLDGRTCAKGQDYNH